MPFKFIPESTIEEIINLYTREGLSVAKISKKYKIWQGKITKMILDRGVTLHRHVKKVNENYFEKIDSEEKAYFLGLLYADGCIGDYKKGQKFLCLGLQWRDREVVEQMKTRMEITNKIQFADKSKIPNRQPLAIIRATSNKLCDDLIKLGCVPRKSLILEFPTHDQVPEHLVRHFIRGLFDGDGSLGNSLVNKKTNWRAFSFLVCGTHNVCSGVKNELMKTLNLKDVKIRKSTTHTITYGGNTQCRKIYNYLYEGATIFLKRKEEKFRKVFDQSSYFKETIPPFFKTLECIFRPIPDNTVQSVHRDGAFQDGVENLTDSHL